MDKSKYQEVRGGVKTDRTFPEKDKKLNKGDSVEGKYIDVATGLGDNNSSMYILEVGNETVGVWGGTVLNTKFKSIEKGSKVAIEYLGEVKGEKGRTYKDFWVGVEAPEKNKEVQSDEIPF